MNDVVGDVLPLALGIAISPVPVIATILMLMSPASTRTGIGFMAGWIAGIVVAVGAFTLLGAFLPAAEPDGGRPILAAIQLLIGVGLMVIAWKQWSGRSRENETAELPKWMAAVDSMSPARGAALGAVLAAANPKNLSMAIAAGVAVSQAQDDMARWVAIAVFVVLAASTVGGPVVAKLLLQERMVAPLDSLRRWLVANNSTIMTVMLLVLGVSMIGKALGSA